MRTLWLILVLAAGCTRPLSGADCSKLNETDCLADDACTAFTCPGCGESTFVGCFDRNAQLPGLHCPAYSCAGCDGLSEQLCLERGTCRADYCPTCDPAHPIFVGCANPGEPMGDCADPSCPPPPPSCGEVADENACTARTDCHGVYEPAACGCAFCCCTPFNHCAPGKADCAGPATCNQAPPDCSNSACSDAFTVSYVNGCYEGCVHKTACN